MAFLTNEILTAYKTAYSKKKKMGAKNYISPKIYHGGKDFNLSKRWYVYYSFIDEASGVMKRQTPITFSVNRRFKTKKERLHHLKLIKKTVNDFLKKGWSPYEINISSENYTAEACLDYALSIKEKEVKQTTYKDYFSRVKQFKAFLSKNNELRVAITEINKRHVSQFLNQFSGAKNRNNCKIALSSIFNILSDESYIEFNFIKEIRNKKVIKKPVKVYTADEVNNIVKLLTVQDPTMLMFIYFVGHMFWRPLEVVRIKVSDIDFEKNVIRIETKTKAQKTKIIPSILLDKLKDFVKGKEGYIFKPLNTDWNETTEINRRGFYSKEFLKFRKKNNIDPEFTLYHFRYTFITKIYLELRKTLSKSETVTKLSLITGHTSKAIYGYIQVNDIELPDDYSKLLKY